MMSKAGHHRKALRQAVEDVTDSLLEQEKGDASNP
jgi:hypothetical protein